MLTSVASAQPQIYSSDLISTAGYFQLSWQSEHSQQFIVQQSDSEQFEQATLIYQGADTATIMSGLADGEYFYQVKDASGDTSPTLKVTVANHSLNKAFSFFALGAVMFVVLVGILVWGIKTGDKP